MTSSPRTTSTDKPAGRPRKQRPGSHAISLLLAWLSLAFGAQADGTDIGAIIAARGLSESPLPMREIQGWKPRKIVVRVPPHVAATLPDFEAGFLAAAGDVPLVFDHSGGWAPDAPLLQGADAVIGFCTPGVFSAAGDSLLWVHSYSIGVDRCLTVDPTEFEGRVFSNSKRLSGPAIAEHAIAMLMSLARGLPDYHRAQAEEKWDWSISARERFGELAGKTLLVAGLGGIGSEVAQRAHGLGMRVIATRNSSRAGPDFVTYVGLADELPALAAQADVIVNALPLTDDTRGLFDAKLFSATKPGAIYINVGRGATTSTDDLLAALASGQLYAAGLDVTEPEPLPEEHPLWSTPRVIITPHVAATGGDSFRRAALIAQENLRRYVAGEALLNPVDMQKGY